MVAKYAEMNTWLHVLLFLALWMMWGSGQEFYMKALPFVLHVLSAWQHHRKPREADEWQVLLEELQYIMLCIGVERKQKSR